MRLTFSVGLPATRRASMAARRKKAFMFTVVEVLSVEIECLNVCEDATEKEKSPILSGN